MSERSLVLCAEPSPFDGGEPCPKERGHEGGHVYWTQTQPHRKRGRNGIWIVDADGKTLMHVTYDGAAQAEDVCALMALHEIAAEKLVSGAANSQADPGDAE